MKIRIAIILAASLMVSMSAQDNAAKTPAKGQMTMQVKSMAEHSKTLTKLPTTEVVDAFLKRMFGYDPNFKYRILDISASTIPNVAHVVVVLGDQQGANHLYITPDGENAIVGDAIPFGVDPFAMARNKLALEAKGQHRGPAEAEVTLVEFSDLQCPYCKASQPVLDRVMKDYPNVRLVFQPFPLSIHPWAKKAASYAECVADQNKESFWSFVQGVYDEQEKITVADADTRLVTIAKAAGVDGEKAAACAAAPLTQAKLIQSEELGKSLGVTGTPTVFLNGRKISAIRDMPYELLKQMIEFEAKMSKTK
ncbi:MAG: thioredoxin domain-containing protein [Acidobacteriales bacterium]|nr:thioredoxin domain-containing protein [Terriglobales bacterium]